MTLFWTKTRKMSELNKKKIGINNDKSPTDSSAGAGNNNDPKKKNWFEKNLWTTALIIVGVIIIFYGFIFHGKSPNLASVGSWSRNHWLWILVSWGIIATLIAINAGKVAKILQTILATIVFLLFIGFPIIGWGVANSGSHGQQRLVENQVLSMPANGDSPRVYTRPGYAISYIGSGFSLHCVYRDGSELVDKCKNGPMLYQYVHDTTGKPNSVTYEFVKPK